MKANVDFPKRTKNSFIYFQVGLIATMLVVLFILEFNFENKKYKAKYIPIDEISQEVAFVYNPAPVTKPQTTTKPLVVNVPKVAHTFKVTKEEPKKEDDNTKLASQDNPSDNQNNTNSNSNPNDNPGDTGKVTNPEPPSVFTVEQLPMFPACKGLSRAEQKACFDEQLAKVIVKHLVYPEDDLENGKQGVAQVEFIIDENGTITNVVALNNKRATFEMQEAAEKAVKRIPKLIPAKQGDKSVRIKYSIPVVFKIRY